MQSHSPLRARPSTVQADAIAIVGQVHPLPLRRGSPLPAGTADDPGRGNRSIRSGRKRTLLFISYYLNVRSVDRVGVRDSVLGRRHDICWLSTGQVVRDQGQSSVQKLDAARRVTMALLKFEGVTPAVRYEEWHGG